MYRIIDGRATGKTSRLMLLAKENDGVIVCNNPDVMRDKAYRYGITGIDFISYEDFRTTRRFNKPVYIDELDLFLMRINPEIKGYSISED